MLVKFENNPNGVINWNKNIDRIFLKENRQSYIDMLKTMYISKTEDYFHEIKDGIYRTNDGDFNAEHEIESLTNYKIKDDRYKMPVYNGVCDNENQILSEHSEIVTSDLLYCVLMTPVYKKDEPSEYGWRWHKWGDYIGNYNIQCEYLYDEIGIEMVYVYSIYEVVAK